LNEPARRGSPPSSPRVARSILRLAAFLLTLAVALDFFNNTWGPVTFACLTVVAVAAILSAREVHILAAPIAGRSVNLKLYTNLILLVFSLGLATALLELGLQVLSEFSSRRAGRVLSMPKEWERRPATVEGAPVAYYWQGKLHVKNADGMRRSTPFPEKDVEQCRILVFGDSLTYGTGVDEKEAYPRLLEGYLSESYRIEVLNLGVGGWQSTDIAKAAAPFVERLLPDLAVYGVCLNDLLDSGEVEQNSRRRRAYPFPLPSSFKWEMKSRTLVAEVLEERYDRLLMRTGLRMDFYDDILKDFDGYQSRFGDDVAQMNRSVLDAGLPPVVAMVLDQYPEAGGRGQEIAMVAENLMTKAGLDIVLTGEYYEEYDGRKMPVSSWEGHPNEEAHGIFAGLLLKILDGHPAIEKCRNIEALDGSQEEVQPGDQPVVQ
jgi:hypothetical protein